MLVVLCCQLLSSQAQKIDFGEFRKYMVPWEQEIETDTGLADPSPEMNFRALIAQREKDNSTIIEDLNNFEEDLVWYSLNKGLPILKEFMNYSQGLEDPTYFNFATTERILRFNKRVMNTDFVKDLGYVGMYF